MIGLGSMFSQSLLHALGWALLHFIWQGAAIALLLAGTLFVLEGYSARLRYNLALGAMMLMPVLLIVTMWRMWASSEMVAIYSAKTLRTTVSGKPPSPPPTTGDTGKPFSSAIGEQSNH